MSRNEKVLHISKIIVCFLCVLVCLYFVSFNKGKLMSAASGKVEGMEVGLTLGLENWEGTLKLSLMDCGCYVKEISIKLDGGASWLYQGYALLYMSSHLIKEHCAIIIFLFFAYSVGYCLSFLYIIY